MRVAALKGRIKDQELLAGLPRIHELPFDARRKRMSTIHLYQPGSRLLWMDELVRSNTPPASYAGELAFIKGAPREMIQICTDILQDQQIRPLDERRRAEIVSAIDRYARQGLRVLGLAFRPLPVRSGAYTARRCGARSDLPGIDGNARPTATRRWRRLCASADRPASAW